MDHLPIWMALRGRGVLVVGGGSAAASKARLAARAGAHVTVVAPAVEAAEAELFAGPGFTHRSRPFDPADVAGNAVVFSASGDIETDRAVAEAAGAAGVPVNAVDRPDLSTFLMPAIVDRSPVVVGISTGGAAPALAVRIRGAIEAALPPRIGALARFADSFRTAVKGRVPAGTARLRFWNRVLSGPIGQAVLAGKPGAARERMLHLLNSPAAESLPDGIVHLVGAGPGDPELLTLRALRLIQEADVLAYDRLVGPGVLEYGRRDAEHIDVGKAVNGPASSQDEIHAVLVDRARAGLRVVRLKGGDPFLFGRGGEEAAALRGAGVAVEVVPGVTAALGCAAAASVPLTHRDHASAVTFVTGHVRDGGVEPDWAALAAARHTLVVYMGLGTAGYLARRLIAHGLAADTPVAVVENGTLPEQRVLCGELAGLGELVTEAAVRSPALLIIGDVARGAAGSQARELLRAVGG